MGMTLALFVIFFFVILFVVLYNNLKSKKPDESRDEKYVFFVPGSNFIHTCCNRIEGLFSLVNFRLDKIKAIIFIGSGHTFLIPSCEKRVSDAEVMYLYALKRLPGNKSIRLLKADTKISAIENIWEGLTFIDKNDTIVLVSSSPKAKDMANKIASKHSGKVGICQRTWTGKIFFLPSLDKEN